MARLVIPEALAWIRGTPEGEEWLARLPDAVADAASRWELALDQPFANEAAQIPVARGVG